MEGYMDEQVDELRDRWMGVRTGAGLAGLCMLKQRPPCPHNTANIPRFEGYNGVEQQHPQAAHKPGQVVQQVAALTLAHLGVFEQHAEPVQRVSQHHQCEQRVGDTLS